MRESIICVGKMGAAPYCFPETGVKIYTYEEICYYLSRHLICYLHTLPEEELLCYIRDELGLDKLYRQLQKLKDPKKDQMKYFAALFREGNYFSEEDIRKILDEYRELKEAPPALSGKWLGDMYLSYRQTSMAIRCYHKALGAEGAGKELRGAIYHNRAVAKARLFRFQDARVDFLKSYQQTGEEESLFGYYSVVALTEGVMTANGELDGFQVSDLMKESFESRFAGASEESNHTDQAARVDRMLFLEEEGRAEEARMLYRKMVRGLQNEFRRELEVNR